MKNRETSLKTYKKQGETRKNTVLEKRSQKLCQKKQAGHRDGDLKTSRSPRDGGIGLNQILGLLTGPIKTTIFSIFPCFSLFFKGFYKKLYKKPGAPGLLEKKLAPG